MLQVTGINGRVARLLASSFRLEISSFVAKKLALVSSENTYMQRVAYLQARVSFDLVINNKFWLPISDMPSN